MPGYTAVDLSRLPAPKVVETLDFEQTFAEMLKMLCDLDPTFDALLESDPTYKILQVAAYHVLGIHQRVNDAARAVMLAYAKDSDLDNLGALFGVTRLILDPGDPEHAIPPVKEDDTDYRRRILLAPEGYSVAGPEGAYIYHALSADPRVLDASATSPQPKDIKSLVLGILADHSVEQSLVDAMSTVLDAADWPGDVTISVLARDGSGAASQDLLDAVASALSAEEVRPLTDHVKTATAEILEFQVLGTRYTYAGPDPSVVLANSDTSLHAYLNESHRLGRDVTLSGLYAAIHVPGIQRVNLTSPQADIVVGRTQCAYCTSIKLDYKGVDD